nr:hypothetical protein [Tanacetum cinerariifolium]
MEGGFLSQKGSEGRRGVKEKSLNRNSMNTFSGIGVSIETYDTMNEDTPVGVASVVEEGVTPSVVDIWVEKEKISSLEDTTIPKSFSPLATSVTTTAGDAPGKSSYANITGKPSGKKVNVRTLFTPEGNRIDVVVVVDFIRAISELFANTTYAFNEDGLSAIATKRDTHLMLDSYTSDIAGEKKNVNKPSQTARGDLVGWKMRFKPQKEYQPVTKKSTASSNGTKKKGVEPTIEVSNSNPFDVLNSVNNDVEFGTNGRTTNLLLTSGQVILVDKAGNPLKRVEFLGEVASVDNDKARFMTSKRVGFGTQSLLEQWRDSYDNDDYVDDPYNDDIYEGQDLSHELQAICANLDFHVPGRKKKYILFLLSSHFMYLPFRK